MPPGAAAQTEPSGTANVEVRVWQRTADPLRIYISARPEGGSWDTLGTIPLPLDDGHNSSGSFRYGDIAVAVPLARSRTANVEVRVWQRVADPLRVYISVRLEGGSWGTLGTIPLPLDDGRSSSGSFRYGDIAVAAPLPSPPEATSAATSPPPDASARPADHPSLRHLELKRLMLRLINDARAAAGLAPVVLGGNAAAQLHAEASLEGCFSSHWGADGLKPSMRYSLAGGYQSNRENTSGLDYCITPTDGYLAIESLDEKVREAMEGWMRSAGHRRNILDPSHKAVNIGLAWDHYNFAAIQHFEGGYVTYERLPTITGGWLELSGTVRNGVTFTEPRDLGVQVYYDPSPHALTRGQISRTYCYASGLPVAAFRLPLGARQFYLEDEHTLAVTPCPDPYDVPANASAPRDPDEAHRFWRAAYNASQSAQTRRVTVPWITAREWRAEGVAFSLRADLRDTLARYGPGVYAIVVWGPLGGEREVIAEYSIFHGVVPPAGYSRYR